MKKRIILFSIGSVQNFIINSRKVCDLSNSSKILSLLINEGIKFTEDRKGQVLLPIMGEETKNAPNYFIMMYEGYESIGQELEEYVRGKYSKMIKDIEYFSGQCKKEKQKEIELQLDSSLDIYWVDYELPKSFNVKTPNEYSKVYYEIYEYLEAVKNARKFVNISEEGRKCSICGCRNSISTKIVDKNLKQGEQLCAVCLLKRVFNNKENNKFNSLAYITLSNHIQKENNMEGYVDFISDICGDLDKYQCVYKENWDEFLSKYDNYTKMNCKSKLEREFKGVNGDKLPKYYCLYRMDIDNLGKWMNGRYVKGIKDLYEYQKNLSQRINDFFTSVRNELTFELKNRVNLIYAGGDDMMVLLPVDCIYEFQQIINDKFNCTVKQQEYKNITYSQGFFVAHYKTPLGEIVRVSKDILELAKKRFESTVSLCGYDKNATVISIMSEGYNNKNVYFKNYMKNQRTIDFIWCELMEYLKKDNSSYFHTELESEFSYIFQQIEKYEEFIIMDMFEAEQKRIMQRSAIDKEYVSKKIDNINSKLLDFLSIGNGEKNLDFDNYFNLFYIIRKLKQNMVGE